MEKNIHDPYTQDELADLSLVQLVERLEQTSRVSRETHDMLGSSWGMEAYYRNDMNRGIEQLSERESELRGEIHRRNNHA